MPSPQVKQTIYKATSTAQMGTRLDAPKPPKGYNAYLYAAAAENETNDATITIYIEPRYRSEIVVPLVPTTDTIADGGCSWSGRVPFEYPMSLRAAYNNHATNDILYLFALIGFEKEK